MPFMYGVKCIDCGLQELSKENYDSQMRADDAFWRCPKCGGNADWDDNSIIMTLEDYDEKTA